MRVTNKMLSNSFLRDMTANMANLQTLQQQMTSGKEIRKPSDDPFKVARAMQLHTDINTNKQYNENINDTINWLDTTDTALDQAGNVLKRVHELLISAGNGGYSDSERQAIKDEINEKVGELSQILNTNFDGKYIFGGSRGTTKPLDAVHDGNNVKLVYFKKGGGELNSTDPEYNMISQKLNVEISQGVTMKYNVTASEILEFKDKNGNSKDLRTILKNIVDHLDSNPGPSGSSNPVDDLTDGDLEDIKSAISNLLKVRSEVGAMQNRMDSAKEKNEEENFNMTEILSKTEDIDITKKTMEYATMQTVYMASLQTSARVLQPSLIDYLR
ncbi:flagellar hook-associated protein 3 [Clostridium tepidiprofundi DSM 19306]|uniref:Flagellar hook-associated protein 3 n=1 Tax=Clostridium tepidiprofundi DSM 19306 TaxID=1121338 RepID=A0A151B4G5_9CLOT|nr:flagellar hook-associated protein FlgL [Clostridium tepidiprofundi]KYH34798.1 flagellar hook-associated protein 3 [Clostridium tepidiprofundi DSM 19306]